MVDTLIDAAELSTNPLFQIIEAVIHLTAKIIDPPIQMVGLI